MKQLQLRCVAPSFVYFCFVFTACGQTLGTPLILIQFQDPGALTGGHDHISLIPSHNGHNGPSLMTTQEVNNVQYCSSNLGQAPPGSHVTPAPSAAAW